MPRFIRLERTGPFKIEPKDFPPDGKSIWICGCGLTRTPPYCDKSHKACADEDPLKHYVYDGLARREITGDPPTAGPEGRPAGGA